MESIDWSKAPEGATHYNAACACPWLKETPASYFHNGDWIEYTPKRPNNIVRHFTNAVKRPQEWGGSGVPPVGTVCEYRLNEYGGEWFTCKIVYVLTDPDHSFVAWCDLLGMDQFFSFNTDDYTLQLRKIKTPEQTAEEARLHAIDEMYSVIRESCLKTVTALYDAGYRKTEEKK